jgi:serine phosphatase RsbU (regulator of sigma subunit)
MPAALIASMLKIAFAAQSAHACDPAQVLSGLNEALYGKFQGHYVTAAYALIDTEQRTLRYAGAGHPPLLLREHSSGEVRRILENGLFLGFFPAATYSTVETPFREGDRVVLYTDGISEMMNAEEEQFGESRLRLFIENHRGRGAAAFVDGLLDRLSQWSGRASGQDPDDVTLLAIRYLDDETRAEPGVPVPDDHRKTVDSPAGHPFRLRAGILHQPARQDRIHGSWICGLT